MAEGQGYCQPVEMQGCENNQNNCQGYVEVTPDGCNVYGYGGDNPYTAYNPCGGGGGGGGGGGAPGAAPNPGVGAGGSAPAGAQYVETGTDFGQFGVYNHDYYRQAVSNGQQGYAVIQAVFDAIEAAREEGLIAGEEAMAIQYSASHKPADKQMAMATAISELIYEPDFTDPNVGLNEKFNMLLSRSTQYGYRENNVAYTNMEVSFWTLAFGGQGSLYN